MAADVAQDIHALGISRAVARNNSRFSFDESKTVGCYSPNYRTYLDREKVYGDGMPIMFEGTELQRAARQRRFPQKAIWRLYEAAARGQTLQPRLSARGLQQALPPRMNQGHNPSMCCCPNSANKKPLNQRLFICQDPKDTPCRYSESLCRAYAQEGRYSAG